MSRLFYHVMQDNAGNLLFGVSGTMRLAGTGTLATIYGDEALGVILPNPMTNHPSFGSFKCYLGPGSYDFYMAKGGYTFETLTGVQGGGSMANQDASAVAITGGSMVLTGDLGTTGHSHLGWGHEANYELTTDNLYVGGQSRLSGHVGINTEPGGTISHFIAYQMGAFNYGLALKPTDTDAGNGAPVVFLNLAGTSVGQITTTATTTTYGTTSDARLKDDVEPLTGAVDVMRALNPVSFIWKADGSPGYGLLAHEVQEVVEGVSTGAPDAVDDAGQVVPQTIDYSRLVPWLISAVKDLTQQVEMLTAQLARAGR